MISPDRDRLAYPLTLGKVGSLALVFQPSPSAWSLGFEDLDRGSMFTICLYQRAYCTSLFLRYQTIVRTYWPQVVFQVERWCFSITLYFRGLNTITNFSAVRAQTSHYTLIYVPLAYRPYNPMITAPETKAGSY